MTVPIGTSVNIRVACADDASQLPAIERSASERFREIPTLAWITDEEDMSPEAHRPHIDAGTVWVADDGELIGFLTAERIDDHLHIWELAVSNGRQRAGIGTALMQQADAYARTRGLSALTLTTFRNVAWNAPYYMRLGFQLLEAHAIGERLRVLVERDTARGLLDRCAMLKELRPPREPLSQAVDGSMRGGRAGDFAQQNFSSESVETAAQ